MKKVILSLSVCRESGDEKSNSLTFVYVEKVGIMNTMSISLTLYTCGERSIRFLDQLQ